MPTNKDETGLLPCPFCGEKPLIRPQCPSIEGDAWTKITCDCRVEPSVTVYEDNTHFETANHLWNTRATPDIPEKAITTIKFHSKGGGFIRLKNELGHLFDVTVPPEKVDVEAITDIAWDVFFNSKKPAPYNQMKDVISHLAAAGYLREPLERIEGLEDE